MLRELDAVLQQPETSVAEFVPLFLRHTHTKLDEIEADIRQFREHMARQRAAAAARS